MTMNTTGNTRAPTAASLHPLIIMNISEHWTRVKAQSDDRKPQKVYGAVLGKLDGRHLELTNSFELKVDCIDNKKVFDLEFLKKREAQYKETFPELEMCGWYCSTEGTETSEEELSLHKQFIFWVEAAVLLRLDTGPTKTPNKLPITLWENAGVEPLSTIGLRQLEWDLKSEESERIGIDHVAKFSTQVGSVNESELAKQIRNNASAANMLLTRIGVIRKYLIGVHDKQIPPNEEIIREANKVCQRFPLLRPEAFDANLQTQETDANSAILLSKMTENIGALSQLVSKVNTLSSDRGQQGNLSMNMVQVGPRKKLAEKGKEASSSGSGGASLVPDLFQM